jgi:hypothetical protein
MFLKVTLNGQRSHVGDDVWAERQCVAHLLGKLTDTIFGSKSCNVAFEFFGVDGVLG